jgi:hypothetical protein
MSKGEIAAAAEQKVNPVSVNNTAGAQGIISGAGVAQVPNQVQVQESETLKTKLKALYRAQDTLPKLIEDPSVPTQKMDDYYVNLKILLNNKGERQEINVKNIFDEVKEGEKQIQNPASKILIIGGAGIGKTTFLHNIAYRWSGGSSEGEMFNDKFDYVTGIPSGARAPVPDAPASPFPARLPALRCDPLALSSAALPSVYPLRRAELLSLAPQPPSASQTCSLRRPSKIYEPRIPSSPARWPLEA